MFGSKPLTKLAGSTARNALLLAAACSLACAAEVTDVAGDDDLGTASEELAQSQTLNIGETEWNQVGEWTSYTNWQQDVVIFEAHSTVSAYIAGDMVFGPSWGVAVQSDPAGGKALLYFEMMNAAKARPAPGGTCSPPGQTLGCWVNLPDSVVGKVVKLSLTKSKPNDGTHLWWSAWAEIGNVRHLIAEMKTPYQGSIIRARNVTFGPSVAYDPATEACLEVPPRTVVVYGAPVVHSPVEPVRRLTYRLGYMSPCAGPGATSAPFYDGAVHVMGP